MIRPSPPNWKRQVGAPAMNPENSESTRRGCSGDGSARPISEEERQQFFEQCDEAYRRLRTDPVPWAEELAERAEWDCTLMDGIDADEEWDEFGRLATHTDIDQSGS